MYILYIYIYIVAKIFIYFFFEWEGEGGGGLALGGVNKDHSIISHEFRVVQLFEPDRTVLQEVGGSQGFLPSV